MAPRGAADEPTMIGGVTLILLAGALSVGAPSAAIGAAAAPADPRAPDPAEIAAIDGLVALDAEIMLLVELGAFGTAVPPAAQSIRDQWASYMDGMTIADLLVWLQDVDGDGADALDELLAVGVPVSEPVAKALGPISPAEWDQVELGRPIGVDPVVYIRARQHLELGNGAAPEDRVAPAPVAPPAANEPAVTQPAVTQPVATQPAFSQPVATPTVPVAAIPDGTVPAAPTAPDSDTLLPVAALVALAAALLGGAATAVLLRRRRVGVDAPVPQVIAATADDDRFELLSEAARRMTSALDQQEIAGIALDQALAMVRARHGAFVEVDELGLTAVATSGDVFSIRSLTGGLLSRVADTGQTVRRVAHDEPAITSLPAALLAAPVIGGGRVVAILFLVRGDATPFSDNDEAAVTRLTPIVASALAAATKHGDATALSRTDPLTGLANRRTLDEDLGYVRSFASPGRCMAVAMVDVDHFKQFNDREGHAAGDEALRTVARALQSGVRAEDRVYRYGGEEFSLLLADVDRDEAEVVAERVRGLVEHSRPPGSAGQPGGALTVSIGLVLVNGADPEASLLLADRALYEAKETGRNRVVMIDATNADA